MTAVLGDMVVAFNRCTAVHVLERLGWKEGSMETRQSSESGLPGSVSMDMVFIIFTSLVFWQLSCGHEQSVNSLGTRQFGTLAAQWAWPCTTKC